MDFSSDRKTISELHLQPEVGLNNGYQMKCIYRFTGVHKNIRIGNYGHLKACSLPFTELYKMFDAFVVDLSFSASLLEFELELVFDECALLFLLPVTPPDFPLLNTGLS